MSDQFQQIISADLLRVIGHRGGTMHEPQCALLELSVATTEHQLDHPEKITLAIPVETIEKVISSLQQSLSILRQSN